MNATITAAVYTITGSNSYWLHIADGTGSNLCPSDAAKTPTDAKVNHPKTKVCGKCQTAYNELVAAAQAEADRAAAETATPSFADITDFAATMAAFTTAGEIARKAVAAAATDDEVTFTIQLSDHDRISARRHRLVSALTYAFGGTTMVFTTRKNGRATVAGHEVRVTIHAAAADTLKTVLVAALEQGDAWMNAAGEVYRSRGELTAQQRDTGYQDVRRAALTAFGEAAAHAAKQGFAPELIGA